MQRVNALVLGIFFAAVWAMAVLADGQNCVFNPDGSITCVISGGGGNSEEGGGSGPETPPLPPAESCGPDDYRPTQISFYQTEPGGTCSLLQVIVDLCTEEMLAPGSVDDGLECPEQTTSSPPPQHPCTTFVVTGGGITCEAENGWRVEATVPFPQTYLDVRPFPTTLVRWPSAIRNGGMPAASGSGSQAFYGRGTSANPNEGDLSDIRLTLTLSPVSSMFVTLPHLGTLSLPDQGASGTPQIVQWEVPSHPAAGGGPLAGSVPGFEELPGDLPVFVGSGRSAYRLSWSLSFLVYEAVEECVSGPNANGVYNCANGTGHRQVTGYEWQMRSSGGEIPPSAVAGLPAALAADLNGDGRAEAYWNNNLTLRRMDDGNRVDNPIYRRAWNWGGLIYWAVREGQGQIGWPGGR